MTLSRIISTNFLFPILLHLLPFFPPSQVLSHLPSVKQEFAFGDRVNLSPKPNRRIKMFIWVWRLFFKHNSGQTLPDFQNTLNVKTVLDVRWESKGHPCDMWHGKKIHATGETAPTAQLVEYPPIMREVAGSKHGQAQGLNLGSLRSSTRWQRQRHKFCIYNEQKQKP
mgnify:CR=1 FL=1